MIRRSGASLLKVPGLCRQEFGRRMLRGRSLCKMDFVEPTN